MAFLFWNVWSLNKYNLNSAIRNSRPPSWDLSSNLSFWSYLSLPFHAHLSSSQTGLLIFMNMSYVFLSYLKSCPPLGMPSGLSVFTENLPSSSKGQLNCFIIIKVCALFSLIACTDGNDWVLIIFTVNAPYTTCKGGLLITDAIHLVFTKYLLLETMF